MTLPLENHLSSKLRIANFCSVKLSMKNVLNLEPTHDILTLKELRRYSDLPYVYLVSKEKLKFVIDLMSRLKSIRSTCYPHALIVLNDADSQVEKFDPGELDIEIIELDSVDGDFIKDEINKYADANLIFDHRKLEIKNDGILPKMVDVIIVGAGVTGLYAAKRLQESKISFCVVEKRDKIGGIWSLYANSTSQVNTSECAYRIIDDKIRSNRDHSTTREILEDIAHLATNVSDNLFLNSKVNRIHKIDGFYQSEVLQQNKTYLVKSKGVILAVNDRVGTPRKVGWEHQNDFQGKIISGISGESDGFNWKNKKVVIVGMGAFAVENAITSLEGGARKVNVVCRRH